MRIALPLITLFAAAPLAVSATPDRSDPPMSQAALAALDPTRIGRTLCRGVGDSQGPLQARLALARQIGDEDGAGSVSMGLYEGVGTTDLPLGPITPLARQYFEQGLALAYGFNHAAAIRSFRQARSIAPSCALCWWGEALAKGPNINAGMESDENARALAALAQAERLAGPKGGLTGALIAAQALRYSEDPDADRGAMDSAYADAMLQLARDHPESNDLALIAADAAMTTTPWNYWDPESGAPRPRIGRAVELVEAVMARSPQHPQASHLYIHLMELPEPRRAEAAADRLRRSSPAALGHLVHMPSHIYYRLGRYSEAMEANVLAAAADEAYLAQVSDDAMVRYGYYPHNVHFLLASAQMLGDVHTIVSQSAKLARVLDLETARRVPWIQAIYAAPYFAQAQFGSHDAILAATAKPVPLDYVEAMRRYTRAIAFAQVRDEAAFQAELGAMKRLAGSPGAREMEAQGFPAPMIIELAAEVAQGRDAMARSSPDRAIAHFRKAADMQRAVPYSEPPFWYYPVTQSLGAAYLMAGRSDDARTAFRAALAETPNNALALYGLAQAEEALGHKREAQAAREALGKIWRGSRASLRLDRM